MSELWPTHGHVPRQMDALCHFQIKGCCCKSLPVSVYRWRIKGLKIPGPERDVPVQFRSRAPQFKVVTSLRRYDLASLHRAAVLVAVLVGLTGRCTASASRPAAR